DPHPVGAVLRHAGPGSYYRFLLDRTTGGRRLDAFVDGAATTLWTGSGGLPQGTDVVLTFDAAGDVLSGYVDGELAFRVRDGSLAAGTAGVFCSGNSALRVEHVEVEAAPVDAFALLADRFAAGDAAAFAVVDEGPVGGPSSWSVAGGVYRQTSSIHDTPIDSATIPKLGTTAVAGDAAWRDVAIQARLRSPSGNAIGICFRYADDRNYYRLSFDDSLGYRRLVKCVDGAFTTLWEDGSGLEPARTHDLEIHARGGVLS